MIIFLKTHCVLIKFLDKHVSLQNIITANSSKFCKQLLCNNKYCENNNLLQLVNTFSVLFFSLVSSFFSYCFEMDLFQIEFSIL